MKLITILGPTASGKTSLAASLAEKIQAEIISADSRQVYKNMDIGTGKDLSDYVINGKSIPYHLIDIEEPGAKYNLFRYQQDFNTAYHDIVSRGVTPILCGGTGLYIEAVLKGYSLSPVPQSPALRSKLENRSLTDLKELLVWLKHRNGSVMHNTSDVDTVQRAIRSIEIELHNFYNPISGTEYGVIDSLIIGVDIDRDTRRQKITNRLKARLEEGMVEEIKALLASGIPAEDLIYYGLEYKYVTEYIVGKLSYAEMFDALEIAIHQFAKRQMTWFRGMERRGFHIHWIDALAPMEEKLKKIISLIDREETSYNQ